jgi:hypothetical protein
LAKNEETQTLQSVREEKESMAIVMPAVSPQQAKAAMKAYQAMVSAILDGGTDYQKIGDKSFKKKSAWRKLATAFNLSVEVISEVRKEYLLGTPDKYFVVEVTAKATAMNGRSMTGLGSCASNERGFAHVEHDVRATAETRAKNRAISDLIGAGEVSAEEMEGTDKPVAQKVQSPKEEPVEEDASQMTEEEIEEARTEAKEASTDFCPKGADHAILKPQEVKKEGDNKGRHFVTCNTRYGGCGWFHWLD